MKWVWIALSALALAGCVSVFPKEPPSQLYRFGGQFTAAAAQDQGRHFNVLALPVDFSADIAGNQILTVSGHQAAYIKNARWVSGARSLFTAALANAFDASGGPARLLSRGEAVQPQYFLAIEVRTFEADYLAGPGSAPTVRMVVHATLSRPADHTLAGETTLMASVPTGANRGEAIAAAFDQADTQILTDLVKWVDKTGAPAAP